MLPECFMFLTGYAGATLACMVIAMFALLIKLLAYFLWKRSVAEVEGQVMDVRRVTHKGGFKYAGGYVTAVKYLVDSVEKVGFLYRQGRYGGSYTPPTKIKVYYSRTGLTRAVRDKDNMPLGACVLVAVESFITYAVISNVSLLVFKRLPWTDVAALIMFVVVGAHAAKNTIESSATWGSIYRRLYLKKSDGYKGCEIKNSMQDRFEKVCALEGKVVREVF